MGRLSRRDLLALSAAAAACPLNRGQLQAAPSGTSPVPTVHLTDLFRPHGDPDDHWDLATLFALAAEDRIDLRAVLVDFPPPRRGKVDPDALAVAQLSYLTGVPVPVLVGTPHQIKSPAERLGKTPRPDWGGILALLRILKESPRPVVLHVVGTCNDLALAGRLEPKLFAEKCAAIYLNAGAGTQDPVKRKKLEYNVALNPLAYAAVFDIPCKIYWLPCFEDAGNFAAPAAYGSYFRFRHDEILPQLSVPLQNFFASLHIDGQSASRQQGPRTWWLQTLLGPRQDAVLDRLAPSHRNMWCTAGFLHSAGLTVTTDGRIVPIESNAAPPLYEFQPIRLRCGDDGVTEWNVDPTQSQRYVFHVLDTQRYQPAMTKALRTLLAGLGLRG